MAKSVIIHVGLHKTGTTSIQVALCKAAAKLRGAGVLYPATGRPPWAHYGQHMFALSVISRDHMMPVVNGSRPVFTGGDRDRLWNDLRSEITTAAADTLVLSSEEFDVLTAQEIRILAERLRPLAIKPGIFLRSYADVLESSYRTSIVFGGYHRDIRHFVQNQRSRLDYTRMIRDWHHVSTPEGLAVVSYEDPAVRRDTVAAFSQVTGIKLASQGMMNESTPAFLCEIARFMINEGRKPAEVRDWVVKMSAIACRGRQNYTCMPQDLRAGLMSAYEREVEEIMSDPSLRRFVTGDLHPPKSTDADIVHCGNICDSLVALANELPTSR